jgi:hypothetical protein
MGKDNDLKWGYTAREKENIREFIKSLYMDAIEYIK